MCFTVMMILLRDVLRGVRLNHFFLIIWLSTEAVGTSESAVNDWNWDPAGYIFYCPCHGRFGNQADQFLGTLAFAKALNRTLILPPWRSYQGKERFVPFDHFFQVEPLQFYHKAILADDFVKKLAPFHWPKERRIAFCHQTTNEKPCLIDAEYFAEFWRHVGVDEFFGSESIKGFAFDVDAASEWIKRFPAEAFPVLSLKGPPAPFPVPLKHWELQKYLQWTASVSESGDKLIRKLFDGKPYLGIHFRNGEDWKKACTMIEEHNLDNLMASTQCLGERPREKLHLHMCYPSKSTVFDSVNFILNTNPHFKHIFVASDSDPYVKDLRHWFPKIHVESLTDTAMEIDLYILEKSDMFLGNCVSSFTSFVRRNRDVLEKPTLYFGTISDFTHEEL